jgi:hypothetical protein
MSDDKGPFELPDSAGEPAFEEDPWGVSIELDENGTLEPSVTVPGGDLEHTEYPHTPGGGTAPFDPEHDPVDRAIFDANHPQGDVQLPYTPDDPLHLGLLPGEHMIDEFPIGPGPDDGSTDLGPGDYVVPADDPALADSSYGSDDSGALDAVT